MSVRDRKVGGARPAGSNPFLRERSGDRKESGDGCVVRRFASYLAKKEAGLDFRGPLAGTPGGGNTAAYYEHARDAARNCFDFLGQRGFVESRLARPFLEELRIYLDQLLCGLLYFGLHETVETEGWQVNDRELYERFMEFEDPDLRKIGTAMKELWRLRSQPRHYRIDESRRRGLRRPGGIGRAKDLGEMLSRSLIQRFRRHFPAACLSER